MSTAAVIVAAGRGARAGGDLPKQWQIVAGRRVADWTLDAFRQSDLIDRIILVVHPDDKAKVDYRDIDIIDGGETRDASVFNGLKALEGSGCEKVLISFHFY